MICGAGFPPGQRDRTLNTGPCSAGLSPLRAGVHVDMKLSVVALFLTAFFFGVVSSQNDGCKDGETWFDGCNNCFCSKGKAACTLKYCADSVPTPPNGQKPSPGRGRCKPGDHWRESCNTCFCTSNGAACTRKYCA